MKNKIIELLKSTKRKNIDEVIKNLESIGYFISPASTKFHGNFDGGLAEHCYNVCIQMMYLKKIQIKINKDLEEKLPHDSIIITSLLHDVCKCDNYIKAKKWRKDANDKWEQYDTYDYNKESLPLGHGEKSVIRLMKWGLDLTEDEILAIRWHMGSFDLSDYNDSKKGFDRSLERPLCCLLHVSDMLASRLMDVTVEKI